MRKTLLSLLLLSLAGIASAQETYSVTINLPANVAKIDIGRVAYNTGVCSRFALPASCTQAQACAASFSATGQPSTGAGGVASVESSTKEEREARGRKGGLATRRRSKAAKALTRAKQAEAARAMWARRKAEKKSGDR